MDEKYIQDLFDQLGGEDKFGPYNDFKSLISSDEKYQRDFFDVIGEDVLGPFGDFQTLVKKKDQPLSFTGQVDLSQPVSSPQQGSLEPLVTSIPKPQDPLSLPGQLDFSKPIEVPLMANGLTEQQDKQQTLDKLNARLDNENYKQFMEDDAKGDYGLKNPFIKDLKVPQVMRAQDAEKNARNIVGSFQEEIKGVRENQGFVGEIAADASQIAPSFNKAFIGAVTSIPKAVGILAKKLDDLTGVDNGSIENYSTYQLGQWLDKKALEIGFTAIDEKRAGFLNSAVPSAFGSMLGMIMTGGPAAGEAGLVKQSVGREIAGTLTSPMAISGALQAAVPEYEAAKAAGKSDSEAFSVFLKNIPGGLTEVIPVANMFTRLNKITGNGIVGRIKSAAAQGLSQGLEESSQEAVQQYLSNKIAQGSYDPKRDLKNGMLEGAGAGFVVGFVMPGVMSAMQNMSTEDRYETKKILDEYLKSQATQVLQNKELNDLKSDLDKQFDEKAKATGKGISEPLPENIQKESVQVQTEEKKAEEVNPKDISAFVEKIKSGEKTDSPEDIQFYENNKTEIEKALKNEPTGEAVKEEVRKPVQPVKEEPAKPAIEESVKPSESGSSDVEATKVGFKELTQKEQEQLPPHKSGKIIAGEDNRLDDLNVKIGDKVINSYTGEVLTVKSKSGKSKGVKSNYHFYDLENSKGETSTWSKNPIFQKVTTGEASVIKSESKSPEGQVKEDKITNQGIGADVSSKEQYVPKDGWENNLMKAREYALKIGIDIFPKTGLRGSSKGLEQLVSEIKDKLKKQEAEAKPNVPIERAELGMPVKEDLSSQVDKYNSLAQNYDENKEEMRSLLKDIEQKAKDSDTPMVVISGKSIEILSRKDINKPTIKEIADASEGRVVIAKVKTTSGDVKEDNKNVEGDAETFGKGFKVLGTNLEGDKVGEDKNGVRAVLKGNVVVSQPVSIIPGRGYFAETPEGQWLTTEESKTKADEIAKKNGFDSPTHLINSVKKRTGETYENVQDIPKEVLNRVANERELEKLTPQENDKTGTMANEGGAGTSSNTPELNAGEPQAGTQQGEATGSQTANGKTGEAPKQQSGDVRKDGNEPTGSTERSPEGRIRPELKDTDLQHNFLYPENWERTKNKTFSKRQAYNDNIAALEVINSLLDNPDTFATDEQKEALSRYNGLGPLGEILLSDNKLGADWTKSNLEFFDDSQRLKTLLKQIGEKTGTRPLETAKSSTRNAYYTSLPVIRSIYEGLQAAGFNGGKILEGSVGTGRFIGGMPSSMLGNSRVKGVDMDVVSALISKYLYPKASILNSPLQSASIPSDYYDLFISNIPFGSAHVYDPQLDKRGGLWKQSQDKLHTYFFAKAIDSVRPGGYVAILTTSNILDTPGNQSTRDLINKETDFVGAVRLSSTAFNADAGTQVVTDIIFLRKKLNPNDRSGVSDISKIIEHTAKHNNPKLPDQKIQYNAYFLDNPSHIFGTEFKAGGLYNAERGYTLEGDFDPKEVGKKLSELAAKMPILERQVQERDALETLQITPLGRMVSGGVVEEKGKYYQVRDFDSSTGKYNIEEISKTIMPAEKDMPILKAFVDTKKQYFDILAKDKIGQDATKDRTQLKKQLKDFAKIIKPATSINSLAKGNKAINRLLQSDPDFYAISALEKSDGTFSDVVEKPVRKELNDFSKTEVPQEAIGFSLNNYGKINLPFIQKVLGENSEESTIERIKDQIFETPDEVVEKTEYLSGNVVEKLKQAKDWAKVDEKYKRNVEALKKVIPEAIPKDKITFQLGASWIPLNYTQQFLDSVFGEGRVTVRYNKATDDYEITSRVVGGEYEAFDPDGHRKGVDVVVKAAITKNVPDFYLTHSDGTKTPLPKLTQDVRDKAQRLQGEFAGLIEADEKTGDELAKLYNEYFNGVVIKQFNGDHLTFPGMQGYDLNPHQKDAIMLLVQKMGGMVDHIVGAGKTLVMTVGAIKMKQMGLVNKPMITTMKSVVPGMVEQIKQQYPEAKILAPTEKDFSAPNRQRLFAQIANNDWDLVIISHDNLGTVPLPPEFESEYIQGEIKELRAAINEMNSDKRDKWAVKQAKALEERIANLKTRLEKLQDKGASASRTDFGTMGVDMLFVDESQQFKNLNFVTKLRNVAGLGTAKGSKRASNLKMVARYLQNMHGGDKGIVFASGTPISNSLVEVYNIFQYMRPSLLKKLQMVSLDQFLKNFSLISSQMEKNVAGVINNKTRLNKFVNVPELASLYSEISDIRGEHNLKLPRPEIKGGKADIILIPQSDTQQMITKAIFDASSQMSITPLRNIGINPQGDAEKALGLVLTTLGTKASIDPRLVFPSMKADGGKIFEVAKEVSKIYKEEEKNKGVQLIFADMGTPKNKNAKLGDRVRDQVIEMYGEDVITEVPKAEEIFKQTATSDIKQKLIEILEISPEEAEMIVDEANNVNSFNVYDALKNELVKKGIPETEIAFIHDAPTKKLKEELFEKVNDAKIRVLIGSTMKMGTGVNVQKKVAAMHHVDVGWRPSDLEQRNGRGIRRGNEYKEVAIKYYGTEQTIDAYRFDLLSRKQSGIDSFRAGAKGLREMDFEDGESMTMSEFAAAISGDTRILDLEKLKSKEQKLRNRVESTKRANVMRQKRINDAKASLEYSRNERRIVNELADRIKANTKLEEVEEEETDDKGKVKKIKKVVAVFKGEVDGETFDTREPKQRNEFYKKLSENANIGIKRGYREIIGTMGGIDIYARMNDGYKDGRIDLGEETVVAEKSPITLIKQTASVTPVTIRTAINSTIRDIKIDIELSEKRYKETLSNLAAQESVKEVNAKEEDIKELADVEAKRKKLADELKAESENQQNKPEEPTNSLEEIISKNTKENADENYQDFSGAMSTGLPIKPIGKVKKAPSDNALLALLAQNGLTREQLENELKEQVKIGDQEVDERIDNAKTPSPKNMESKWGEILTNMKTYATQHFKKLNANLWAREANILREFQTLYPWAKGNASQYVKTLVDGMTRNQYKVFSMRIILADMLESIDKGLNMVGPDGKLPFGFKDRDQVDRALTKYDLFMKADPRIQRAFDMREEFMAEFKKQLIDSGLMDETDIESYYHRRVLEYHAERENQSILFGKDIADKKRDFQKKRKGTRGLDYSTNFLETEWKVVSEGLYEMEKQKILKDLVAPFEVKLKAMEAEFEKGFAQQVADYEKQFGEGSPEVERYKNGKRALKRNYLHENLPEGYTFYRVSEDNRLFWAKTVTQKTIDRAIDQAEVNDASGLSESLQIVDELIGSLKSGLMVGPKRKQYMIPTQLAEELVELAKSESLSPPDALINKLTSTWKQLMILSPTRLLRYNLNNMGSDIDRLVQVEPKILKFSKEATTELWRYLKYGETTPQLLEAMRGDVINSGFQISELADVSEQSWAKTFAIGGNSSVESILGKEGLKKLVKKATDAPGNLWDQYINTVAPYVQFRENILRYAAYKLAAEKTAKGETFYWASPATQIRQITDVRQRNARLARDVFGDYMNLSRLGQDARRTLLPFYSWFEVNMKTHYNLLKNASNPKDQREMIKNAALRGIPFVAFRMARAYAMLGLVTAAAQAWNKYAFGLYGGDDETEKRLRQSHIKGMQLIVGVSEDGKIKTIPIQGAFYDFIDFFGLWTIGDDVERIFTMDDPLNQTYITLQNMGKNVANKGAQLATPFIKSPVEMAFGVSAYPDVFNPIPINDNWEYVFKSLTLGDEYNYLLTNKPQRQSYWERKFSNSLLREFDTEMLSYYAAKKIIGDYEGSATGGRSEAKNPTIDAKKDAEYKYMLALRFEKYEEADKWLQIFRSKGGKVADIHRKIKTLDPFNGVRKERVKGEPTTEWNDLNHIMKDSNYKAQTHFGKQLTKDDRFTLIEAMKYYNRLKDNKNEYFKDYFKP